MCYMNNVLIGQFGSSAVQINVDVHSYSVIFERKIS